MSSETPRAPSQQPKLVLHWLDKSRAHRILWLLEELNLEYELKVWYRQPTGHGPPELKEIHTLGRAPILTLQTPDMEKPRVLIESGAIVEYVLGYFGKHLIPERYPKGKEGQIGAETEEWIRYRIYMHYAEGSLMPPLLVKLVSSNLRTVPLPFFIKPIARIIADKIDANFDPGLRTHLDFLEAQLASSPNDGKFLCGSELTGADIMMIFPLEGLASSRGVGIPQEKYPNLTAYLKQLRERETYQRAVKKAEEISGQPFEPIN